MEQDSSLRLGFNSLGASASVNHLHVHAVYINTVLPGKLPIEDTPTILASTKKFIHLDS
jgi:hypothetical protein